MPYTSEIEKLERRYAENPKGRNFAPLADAYRKAGQVDQAIELCKSGLERHPDYVSAHIVHGRCLIDQHDDSGAEQVFRKVLELDPENVIAFKGLAESAGRGNRPDEVVEWLTKLLSADPMNGDAAEALAVAKRKAAQVAKPTVPIAPAPAPAIEAPEFVVEQLEAPPAPVLEAAQPSSEFETFDGAVDFGGVTHGAALAQGFEVQEEVVLRPSAAVEGLARTHYEGTGAFKLAPPPPPPPPAAPPPPELEEDDLPQVDLPLIMPDDVTRAAPRVTPPPPSPRAAQVAPAAPAPAPAPARARAPAPPAPAVVPAAVALSDDDGAADTAALSRAEPVLTETMAELYLRQGHREEALRVYLALQVQRPGDARLRAKVEALLGGGKGDVGRGQGAASSGQTVQAFLKSILASRPGVTAAPESAATTPLDSAFATARAEPELPGAPAQGVEDDLSLDQVFGEEAGRPSVPTGEAPAALGSLEEAATGGFSFDEFFGSGGAPGAGASPAAPTAPPRTSGPPTKPPVEEENDLDQFQAWLKGLKS